MYIILYIIILKARQIFSGYFVTRTDTQTDIFSYVHIAMGKGGYFLKAIIVYCILCVYGEDNAVSDPFVIIQTIKYAKIN
jgi:hypothetical protein